MLIRWKSGYVAYWVRGIYYLTIGALIGGLAALAVTRWFGDFGTYRHHLSTAASIAFVANLGFALRRRRKIRFVRQSTWLKAHWVLAGFGLTLMFTHSALDPGSWSGWAALLIGSAALLTGFVTHFTRRYTRYYAVRVHLVVVLLLVGGLVLHGRIKLWHPDFPLKTPTAKAEVVHNVACATCHTVRNEYDRYTCLNCHTHNTPEIREQHRTHGVTDDARCLDCHKARIEGKTYFTGTGRWTSHDAFDFGE